MFEVGKPPTRIKWSVNRTKQQSKERDREREGEGEGARGLRQKLNQHGGKEREGTRDHVIVSQFCSEKKQLALQFNVRIWKTFVFLFFSF